MYYIYIDSTNGTLIGSVNPWTLNDTLVPVATIKWNNTLTPKYIMADERHSCLIDRRMHYYEHFTHGTEIITLGAATGCVINSDNNPDKTFAIAECKIADEDLIHTLAQLPDPNGTATDYFVVYRTGASTFGWKASNMPFVYNVGNANNIIQYDNGTSGMVDCGVGNAGNTRWVNSYLLLTNVSGAARYMIIMGQAQYTSLALAQAESIGSLKLTGFPVAEAAFAYRMTWTTVTSTSQGKCRLAVLPVAVVASALATVSSGSATDHNTLANLTTGDAHSQYAYLAGRSGGQTLIGGFEASDNLTLQSTADATRGAIIINDQLKLYDGSSTKGMLFGDNAAGYDTNLYRSAANTLKTDDNFVVSLSLSVLSTTNQIVLGVTNTTTLNATAPAASRIYTIPDTGGAASFILSTSTPAQGDVLYYSGTTWVSLTAGVSGKFLKTQGAAANPTWDYPTTASLSDVLYSVATTKPLAPTLNAAYTAPGASQVLATSLELDLPMYEGAGVAVDDISANNRNSASFSATWNAGAGLYGPYLAFSAGSTNSVKFGNYTNFNYNSPFSIAIRFKIPAGAGWQGIMSKCDVNYNGWFVQVTPANKLQFLLAGNNLNNLVAKNTDAVMADDTWYTVVITNSGSGIGSGIKFYVGNSATPVAATVSQDNLGTNAITNTGSITVGSYGNDTSYLTGNIAYVALWSRELQAVEAANISGTPYALEGATGLVDGALSYYNGSDAKWEATADPYISSIRVKNLTNQITLGTTKTLTINSTAPSASRVYTIPDAGGAANFIVSTSTPVQGDILYNNGTTWVSLVAGDSGKFLKTQGAGANPMWDTPAGGPGGGGYKTIWVPANTMVPSATSGATPSTNEWATNHVNRDVLIFTSSAKTYAEFNVVLDEGWNLSTIKIKFFWTYIGVPSSTVVEWGVDARALNSGDAIDQAFGTAQVIAQTRVAANTEHITSATPALTVAGTPAVDSSINFRVYRNIGGANDNLGIDAWLSGVLIQYNAPSSPAAW
jgi:hypothetical protein